MITLPAFYSCQMLLIIFGECGTSTTKHFVIRHKWQISMFDSDQDKKFIAEVFSNHLSTKEIDNSTQVWADEFWWGVDATFSAL